MAYWLMKSEPDVFSWDDLANKKAAHWDGVRNFQASNNMRAMRRGDKAFFYHSNKGRAVVGIVEISKEYYPDHTDKTGRFGMVDVKPFKAAKTPVTLQDIKADDRLKDLALVKQSRLSVSPIDEKSWKIICKMAGVDA